MYNFLTQREILCSTDFAKISNLRDMLTLHKIPYRLHYALTSDIGIGHVPCSVLVQKKDADEASFLLKQLSF